MQQNYITNPFPSEICKACICFFLVSSILAIYFCTAKLPKRHCFTLIGHIKKKRGVRTITRPTFWGLRIAHLCKTSNAEVHAYNDIGISYNADIYHCYCFDRDSESCEVSERQNKA